MASLAAATLPREPDQPAEDKDGGDDGAGGSFRQAEIDIMIAEKSLRGTGIGQEASLLMMLYSVDHLPIRRFFCKINENNVASLQLFRKMGFVQCDYAECFRQVELELKAESPAELALKLGVSSSSVRRFRCSVGIED